MVGGLLRPAARENARASEESLGIRRDADSPAEEFAQNGPFRLLRRPRQLFHEA
jgi:hypothetical protein